METETKIETEPNSNCEECVYVLKKRNKTDDPQYYNKLYHSTNKPMVCECGLPITSRALYNHKKTKKHIFLMEHKL